MFPIGKLAMSQAGVLGLSLGLSIPVALALIGFGIFWLDRKRIVKTARSLGEVFDSYHKNLTTNCKESIKRLEDLGRYSSYYAGQFNQRNKQYQEILSQRDKKAATDVAHLKGLVDKGRFKEARENLRPVSDEIDQYAKAVDSFTGDLSSLLQEDINTRDASLSDKQKLRKIRQFYDQNQNELKPLEKSFTIIFTDADKTLADFDRLTNESHYKEARALLPQLDALLNAILQVLPDLPKLETLVSTVLPSRVKKMNDEYQAMGKEGYVLTYLGMPEKVKAMDQEIDALREKLLVLDTAGVKERIDQLTDSITDVELKFEGERKAKETFEKECSKSPLSSFQIEKRYSYLMNEMPGYQKTFVLHPSYIETMDKLKNDIESINYLKQDLDSYLEAGNRQPYSVLTSKSERMRNEIAKVTSAMDGYEAYLNGLKEKSEKLYLQVRDEYVALKEAQTVLDRKIGVPATVSAFNPRFKAVYDSIAAIDRILLTPPVDVDKAEALFEPFKTKSEALIADVAKAREECDKAEASFLYANAFRDYSNTAPLLNTAEKSFFEGDFERSTEASLEVIDAYRVKPAAPTKNA